LGVRLSAEGSRLLDDGNQQEAQQRFENHDIDVREPEDGMVTLIEAQADEHGLSVSRTDIKLLALAKDVDGTLITDDYQLQNLAKQCDITVQGFVRDEIDEATTWTREFVDRCGEAYPGQHDAMEAAFLRSAKLEYRFWEMAYTREGWDV